MGFQYNGISSQSMNIKARLTGWQMVPTLRSNTEIVPGKAGLADFGADSGERYIDVSCNVYPQKTFAGLVAVLDRAAAWLDPTVGTKQLVLDLSLIHISSDGCRDLDGREQGGGTWLCR